MLAPQRPQRNIPPLSRYGDLRVRELPASNLFLPVALRTAMICCASSSVINGSCAFSTITHSEAGRSRPCLSRTFQTPYPQYWRSTLGCNRACHVELPQYFFLR